MTFSDPTIEKYSDDLTIVGERHASLEEIEGDDLKIAPEKYKDIEELMGESDIIVTEFDASESYWSSITKAKSVMTLAKEYSESTEKKLVNLAGHQPDDISLAEQILGNTHNGIAVGVFYQLSTYLLTADNVIQKILIINDMRKQMQEQLDKTSDEKTKARIRAGLLGIALAEAMQKEPPSSEQGKRFMRLFKEFTTLRSRARNIYFAHTISNLEGKVLVVVGNAHVDGLKEAMRDPEGYRTHILQDAQKLDLSLADEYGGDKGQEEPKVYEF